MANIKQKFMTIRLQACLALLVAWLFFLFQYLLRTAPSVFEQELRHSFMLNAGQFGSISLVLYIAYVPLQIFCGLIVDWLGARKVIAISSCICLLGVLVAAMSTDLFSTVLIGYFIIGIGAACAFVSCAKIGAQYFSVRAFPVIIGLTMVVGMYGASLRKKLPYLLELSGSWQSALLLVAVFALPIACLAWWGIEDPKPKTSKQFCVKQQLANLKRDLWQVVGSSQTWLIGLYGALAYFLVPAFLDWWAGPFLEVKYHFSSSQAAALATTGSFGVAIGSMITAFLANRFKSYVRIMGISTFFTLLFFLFIVYIDNLSLFSLYVGFFLAGFATGGQSLAFSVARARYSRELSGAVVGIVNFVVMLGAAVVGLPLVSNLLNLFWTGEYKADGTPYYTLEVYQAAFVSFCVVFVLGVIITFFIKETYPKEELVD
ncbi:MAG: hypothetical protein RLZ12_723 [Bacillota bacterium]